MGTILDYLKQYGDLTFRQKPFNDVDSLILCQFSYLKFDGLVPWLGEEKPPVSMLELESIKEKGNLFADERYAEDNSALYYGMLRGKRFGAMRIGSYVNLIDKGLETQFSAAAFYLPDDLVYIAYRGTDESLVGWKEDFYLAFSKPAVGQVSSVKYITEAAGRFPGEFMLGGHSKGGNLAVYAAMNCSEDIRDRIVRIYSHDGPGFRPEVMERCGYDAVKDRIVKIIPHSSMVGMLLESHESYQVVESKTFGLLQHNPYTWRVENDHFVYAKDVYSGRRFMDETLNAWIMSLDEEHIKAFVETLFGVIEASRADNLIDFTADWKKSMSGVISALKEVDEESKGIINQIIRSLFEMAKERLKAGFQEHTQEELQKLQEKAEGGRKLPAHKREKKL